MNIIGWVVMWPDGMERFETEDEALEYAGKLGTTHFLAPVCDVEVKGMDDD